MCYEFEIILFKRGSLFNVILISDLKIFLDLFYIFIQLHCLEILCMAKFWLLLWLLLLRWAKSPLVSLCCLWWSACMIATRKIWINQYMYNTWIYIFLFSVQRGYLFMLKQIHEEAQLVDYLCQLCESPLSDDEKKDMRDGKGYFKKRELLKCLTSKGETACREFLEKFKCYQNLYSQFQNAVQSVTNTGSWKAYIWF